MALNSISREKMPDITFNLDVQKRRAALVLHAG
jgi:hypothetical protein